ncbi:beta-galactosidase [Simiduia litorea]|uniref:agarase n=1 Tax=Simiduia litorea TaxID=1435348 RepID=UPI0036F36544
MTEYSNSHQKITRYSAAIALAALIGCGEKLASEQSQHDTKQTAVPLINFENNGKPYTLTTDGSVSTRVITGMDGQALAINFQPEDDKPAVTLTTDQPWQWSDKKEINLAFDASNTGTESIQVYVSIHNDQGDASHYSVNIAAGESGTYYLLLAGKAKDADLGFKKSGIPAWESSDEMAYFRYGNPNMDLSNITAISLSTRGNLKPKTMLVDNFRLRTNPDYTSAYREKYVDRYGQNANLDFPIKVHSDEALKAIATAELEQLAKSKPMDDRSRFGGWKDGPKLEATGFFRTQKVDDKWWLVDPEGYLFFSHGLANVRMANLTTLTGVDFKDESVRYVDPNEVTPEDSIGIVKVSDAVRNTAYIASDVRHDMFSWLPDYKDPLADHYSYRRKDLMGPLASGETFSFYRANLERRYGETEPESYVRQWEKTTLDRFVDWGFTSMGNWVDPAFYPNQKMPYFANGWIIGDFKTLSAEFEVWSPMPDPFDPEFVRRAGVTIDVIAKEIQASPWCVGVFVDNEKSWGLREGSVSQRYGLILNALARAADESPAKAAFTKALQQRYQDIEVINQRWNANIDSWEALAQGFETAQHSNAFVEDLSYLLELLSEEYFRVVHDTLAKTLPNHLYMGVRMASWGMPEETIKASVKYSDVLSFNVYEEGIQPKAWRFLDDIDLPTIIGEFHIGATRENGLYHPGLVQADDQTDRANMYLDYMNSVLAQKTMVGAHWFQYVDSPISGRAYDGENYNVGFVSATDIPYPEMVKAAKQFNTELYPKRFAKAENTK